jgi:hypothetical protein
MVPKTVVTIEHGNNKKTVINLCQIKEIKLISGKVTILNRKPFSEKKTKTTFKKVINALEIWDALYLLNRYNKKEKWGPSDIIQEIKTLQDICTFKDTPNQSNAQREAEFIILGSKMEGLLGYKINILRAE